MDRVNKQFLLKKHFDGLPKEDDLEIVETTLPPLADGEFMIETHYLSVDPYMRPYSRSLKEGTPMIGAGVGKVVESKNNDYPVGTNVTGPFGWSTRCIPSKALVQSSMFRKMPSDIELSHTLGVLGLTGLTAYFGLLDICNPKAGETVFVNTAAGAVGSIVGQIAKIKGCRVVGCSSSEKKLEFLKEIGFDAVFNYKNADFDKTFTELFPKGIDCFFDNVGGAMYDAAMKHMNKYGRVSLCGCISMYNNNVLEEKKGPYVHMDAIPKELKIQGFMAPSFYGRFDEAFNQLQTWISEGKLQHREQVVEGFENMPKAFIGLFNGENIGKVVVKVK